MLRDLVYAGRGRRVSFMQVVDEVTAVEISFIFHKQSFPFLFIHLLVLRRIHNHIVDPLFLSPKFKF